MPGNLTDKLTVEIDVDTGKAKKGFSDYDGAVSKAASASDKLHGSLAKNIVQGNLLSAAIQKGALSLVSFGKSSVAAAAQTETLKANLQAFFGSAERTETAFKGMREQAARLPLSINQIAAAFNNLGGAGLAATDIAHTIDMLDDAAQGSADKFERLALNFQQITAVGEASAANLKRFAKDNVPIYDALSAALGVSKGKLKDMVAEGKIGAAEISKAFEELTKEGGAFFGGHAVLAGTFAGKMDDAQKATTRLKTALGEVIINATLTKNIIKDMSGYANYAATALERAAEVSKAKGKGDAATNSDKEVISKEKIRKLNNEIERQERVVRNLAGSTFDRLDPAQQKLERLKTQLDNLKKSLEDVQNDIKTEEALANAPPPPAAPEPPKEAAAYLDKMRGKLDELTKSEYELALATFKATKPVGAQADEFEALFAKIEEASNKKDIQKYLDDLQDELDKLTLSEQELLAVQLQRLGASDEEIARALMLSHAIEIAKEAVFDFDKEMENLEEATKNALKESVSTGFSEIGKSLGEGASATEAMSGALASMAQHVLSQTGPLMINAGLAAIAANVYDPRGWALLAAGGLTTALGGAMGSKSGSKKSEEQTVFTYTNADDYYKKKQFARGEAFHNSVLSRPTPFLFGNGAGFSLGIAGEAGDESVMPLKRGPSGMLGVRAYGDGGGRAPVVKVIVINNTGEEARTEEGEDADGNQITTVIIGEVKNGISGGSFDGVLSGRYGIKAQGV